MYLCIYLYIGKNKRRMVAQSCTVCTDIESAILFFHNKTLEYHTYVDVYGYWIFRKGLPTFGRNHHLKKKVCKTSSKSVHVCAARL